MKRYLSALAGVFFALTAGIATAETFPSGPVTFVVPFGPGASSDIFARYIAQQLTETWGQPVLVENMPGAGGSIGTTNVARSAADGHRILFLTSTYTTNAAAQTNLPYDPRKDLACSRRGHHIQHQY